jgi:SAM-dependent methyltransferase
MRLGAVLAPKTKGINMIDIQWYKKIWSLDIKNQTWVEDTKNQVDFITKELSLVGNERILDLACGFGRHSICLAQQGFDVVGIDITKAYIDDAKKETINKGLRIEFICDDIRNINYTNEFDVVLNLADGAIGYLETEADNNKIFDVISNSLKPHGKHFMDICSADHAEMYFPKKHWEIGTKTVLLPCFDWDSKERRMLYSQWEPEFGKILERPKEIVPETSTRLYSKAELTEIFKSRNMEIVKTYSNYYGKPDSPKEIQLMVYSKKRE